MSVVISVGSVSIIIIYFPKEIQFFNEQKCTVYVMSGMFWQSERKNRVGCLGSLEGMPFIQSLSWIRSSGIYSSLIWMSDHMWHFPYHSSQTDPHYACFIRLARRKLTRCYPLHKTVSGEYSLVSGFAACKNLLTSKAPNCCSLFSHRAALKIVPEFLNQETH